MEEIIKQRLAGNLGSLWCQLTGQRTPGPFCWPPYFRHGIPLLVLTRRPRRPGGLTLDPEKYRGWPVMYCYLY